MASRHYAISESAMTKSYTSALTNKYDIPFLCHVCNDVKVRQYWVDEVVIPLFGTSVRLGQRQFTIMDNFGDDKILSFKTKWNKQGQ